MKTPIQKAVDIVGSQVALAAAISSKKKRVSPGQVSHWYTGLKQVPPHHCIPVEEATWGLVTRYELRPDVFGNGG